MITGGRPDAGRKDDTMDGKLKYPNVEVQLSGEDGNAFAVVGAVRRALRLAGVSAEEMAAFQMEAFSGDYNHLLAMVFEWVEVT